MTAKDFLMTSQLRNIVKTWKRFWADANGAVLFYITATLPALVGFSLLAIDASRVMTLHTSLQKGSDALAIAAAGELDRGPGAIDRANVAMEELLANAQLFGLGAPAITRADVQVRFFTEIPADDATEMPPNTDSTWLDPGDPDNDSLARFVEVTVDPYDINAIFPASFLGAANSATVRTTSVAGNDSVVCKLMALFICNPYELPTNTDVRHSDELLAAAESRTTRRRQILMRHGPGPTSYGPGNYGFLDMGDDANGAKALKAALAFGSPETCFIANGVDTKPGENAGPVWKGINVRFGISAGLNDIGVSDSLTDWRTRPAKNIRMGQQQNSRPNGDQECDKYEPDTPANAQPLPRDPCFAASNCVDPVDPLISTPWIGGGNWDANLPGYWAANLPSGVAPPTPGDVVPDTTDGAAGTPVPAMYWTEVTRHDIYNYEIAENHTISAPTDPIVTEKIINLAGQNGEHGNPFRGNSCVSGYTETELMADTVDRRIINGAIINCHAYLNPPSNGSLGGKQTNVPVVAFAEFFVTEPADEGGSGTAGDIYAELVRVVEPGNGGTATSFDQVQLYR